MEPRLDEICDQHARLSASNCRFFSACSAALCELMSTRPNKTKLRLVAGPSNMRPRRAQFRGEKLPAYSAPSDDWGHFFTRSRLDLLFGLCVCEFRTPWPMGAPHTWGRDVREVTQAVFPWFSPTSLGLRAGQGLSYIWRRCRSLDSRRPRPWVRKGAVAALPDDADRK
jgi:hypothetical protein